MPRIKYNNGPIDLTKSFTDDYGDSYEPNGLVLYVKFLAHGPIDRATGLSVNYDGTPPVEEVILQDGSRAHYNAVEFSNAQNTNAVVSDTVNGSLSPSSVGNGDAPTSTSDLPFSISVWVKTASGTYAHNLCTKKNGSFQGYSLYTQTDQTVRLCISGPQGGSRGFVIVGSTNTLTVNRWHHIVATYDGRGTGGAGNVYDGMKIYIDGFEETPSFTSDTGYGDYQPDWDDPLYIGADQNGGLELNGSMTELAYWNNRELTPENVSAIYNATKDSTREVFSGYLDNPVRVIISERDNATGSYPTVIRTTGRSVTLGNSPISPYDATREIIFGPADDVHYGDVLQRVDHDKYLDNWIASPNQDDVLGQSHGEPSSKYEMFTTGVVSPFASTQGMKISIDQRGVGSPRHDFEPFNESRVYLGDTSFYKVGTPENVYPGFSSPLDDKIQIVIPIDSAEERTLSRFNAWQMLGDYGSDRYPGGSFPYLKGTSTLPEAPFSAVWSHTGSRGAGYSGGKLSHFSGSNTEFSGSYFTGFKYYNPVLKVWQDQGLQTGPGKIGHSGADQIDPSNPDVYIPPWRTTTAASSANTAPRSGGWGTFYTMFYHGRKAADTVSYLPQGTMTAVPTWELDLGHEQLNVDVKIGLNVHWPASRTTKQYQFTMSHHMGFMASNYNDLLNMGYSKIGAATMAGSAPNMPQYHATASNVFKMSNYITSPFALEKVVIEIPVRIRRKNGNIYANRPRDPKGNRGDGFHDSSYTVDSAIRDIDNYVFFLYRQSHSPDVEIDTKKDFQTSQRFIIASGSVACFNPAVFNTAVQAGIEKLGLPHNPAVTIKLKQTHDVNGAKITPTELAISGSSAAGMEGVFTGSIFIEMIPAVASGQFLGGSRFPHRFFQYQNNNSGSAERWRQRYKPLCFAEYPFFAMRDANTPSQVGTIVIQDFWPGGTTFSKPVSGAYDSTPLPPQGYPPPDPLGAIPPKYPNFRGVVFAIQDGGHMSGDWISGSAGLPLGLSFNGAFIQGPNEAGRVRQGPASPSIQYFGRESAPLWPSNGTNAYTRGFPIRYPQYISKDLDGLELSQTDPGGPIMKSPLPEDSRPLRCAAGLRTLNEAMTLDSKNFPRLWKGVPFHKVFPFIVGTGGEPGFKYASSPLPDMNPGKGVPQFGEVNLPIVFGDAPVSTPSPYILLPGDELILGCDAGISAVPCSGTQGGLAFPAGVAGITGIWDFPLYKAENTVRLRAPAGLPTSGSLCEISGSFLVFEKGPAKLTLFGSMVKNNKEKLFELNQNLSSDAIHEDIKFDAPVVDQFDIENRGEIDGGYTSDYVVGTMGGSFPLKVFQSGSKLESNGAINRVIPPQTREIVTEIPRKMFEEKDWPNAFYPHRLRQGVFGAGSPFYIGPEYSFSYILETSGSTGPNTSLLERTRSRSFAKSRSIYTIINPIYTNETKIFVMSISYIKDSDKIPRNLTWYGIIHHWGWPTDPEKLTFVPSRGGWPIPGEIKEHDTYRGGLGTLAGWPTLAAATTMSQSIAPSPSGVSGSGGLPLDRHGIRHWNRNLLETSKTSTLLRCTKATDFNERYFDTMMPNVYEWAKKSKLITTSEKNGAVTIADHLNGLDGCTLNESSSAAVGNNGAHHMAKAHKSALPYHLMEKPRQIAQNFRIILKSYPSWAGFKLDPNGDFCPQKDYSNFQMSGDEFGPAWSRVSWVNWRNVPSLGDVKSYWSSFREVLNSTDDPRASYDVLFRKGYDLVFRRAPKLITAYLIKDWDDGSGSGTEVSSPDPPSNCADSLNAENLYIFVYSDDVCRLFYNMGPGAAHGYSYGILDTSAKYSSAIFRYNRYGQNRDMLEQRQFAKFFITPTSTPNRNSINPDSRYQIGVGEQESPVTCYFVDSSDGRSIVDPYTTDCSNMDLEASSSCPFTDGHICNRYERKPIYFMNTRVTCVIKGTQINTDLGEISVEDVTTDTRVLSHDFRISEMGYFDVINTFSNTVNGWCKIKTGLGFELGCSLDHPIMSKDAPLWELCAKDASIGDHVWAYNDGVLVDDKIESIEIFEELIDVYNMTVKDTHTYISNGILSHNVLFVTSTATETSTSLSRTSKGGGMPPLVAADTAMM